MKKEIDNVSNEAIEENSKPMEDVNTSTEGTEEQKPTVLLGIISYTKEEDYEAFLDSMDINKAVFILQAAVNYAQSKGAYNIVESEMLAKASRVIKSASTKKN